MQRDGAARLKMGCDMFDAARTLMRAGFGDANGTDRSPAMQARVFQRTYGRDFDEETAARIVARLLRTTLPSDRGPTDS
jgi:hypothetical protein